jgi:hypothetical protein
MLKWVFGVLVLLNLGLAMWASWYRDTDATAVVLPRAPVNPEGMRLVTDPAARLMERPRDEPPEKELSEVIRVCHAVGPFSASNLATDAGAQIRAAGLDYRLRTVPVTEKRYLVYIGPLPSTKVAVAVQKRLTRLGFKDHAVVHEGDLRNAVSVGVFEQAANADQMKQRLAKHKIKTATRVLAAARDQYWLDVDAADNTLSTLGAIKWRSSGIGVVENACIDPAAAAPEPAK